MLLPTTISLTVTTFGCWEINNVLISLRDVMGNPSFSLSILSLFKATILLVRLSFAL